MVLHFKIVEKTQTHFVTFENYINSNSVFIINFD